MNGWDGMSKTFRPGLRREPRRWWLRLSALLAIALSVGLWLALTSGDDGAEAQAACTQGRDCTVLLAVQAQLEGTATDALNWSADLSMTSWDGVRLGSHGRVTRLTLNGKGLTGTLPARLSELRELQYLRMSDNALTGGIPKEWATLPELREVSLMGNRLTGGIPREFGSTPKLGALYLRYNELTGSRAASTSSARRAPASCGRAACSRTRPH